MAAINRFTELAESIEGWVACKEDEVVPKPIDEHPKAIRAALEKMVTLDMETYKRRMSGVFAMS